MRNALVDLITPADGLLCPSQGDSQEAFLLTLSEFLGNRADIFFFFLPTLGPHPELQGSQRDYNTYFLMTPTGVVAVISRL